MRWTLRSSLTGVQSPLAPVLPSAFPATPTRDERSRP